MPSKPKRHTPIGAASNRIRGRRGVELRERRLNREPLCRHCLARGEVREAVTPDHILPLAFGGADTDDNIQCLCEECHAVKTAFEGAAQGAASNHPDWLKPSAISLTIVCGPPASGKTTYVLERAGLGDTIIDIDRIAERIDANYRPWSGALQGPLLNQAIRVRNAMLGSLSRARHGKAWFIVAAPTKAERDWWLGKLGGEIVLLDPGHDECRRRAIARGTPAAVEGIAEWHVRSGRPWARTVKRQRIGHDGWPVG